MLTFMCKHAVANMRVTTRSCKHINLATRGMAKKKKVGKQGRKKGKGGGARKKIVGPTLKKALADAAKHKKLFASNMPGYMLDINRRENNKNTFKNTQEAEATLPHAFRVIRRRKRDKNFMDDVDKIKEKPYGVRREMYQWYSASARKTLIQPSFTNRGGIDDPEFKIKWMGSMHEDLLKYEGYQKQFNRLSDFRHNRGYFEKPSKLKRIERSRKISGRNAKAAVKTLQYLDYMKENRLEQKQKRKEYLASFEQFGEVDEAAKNGKEGGDENQEGINTFDFSILGSASKSKVRYAPKNK
jgi:hypothetical protein